MTKLAPCMACLIALCTASPALTEDALPDKSAYTLFNPVPDNLMRTFSLDRPAKDNSPYTVDAGHFQYESDIFNWTHDRASGVTTNNLLLFDPVLKAGLTQNTDLEIALAPFNFNYVDGGGSNHAALFGFGDVFVRVKFALFGNDGGDYALAVVPYVKAPTASRGLGNNHWEGGFYAPFNINLPDSWMLSFQTELDILENAALDGVHDNYQNLIQINHPVFVDNLTGTVEFWSDVNNDRGAATQYTLDFALAWLAKDNLQLDAGVNIGMNKAAPDLQLYTGISQRF